MSTTPTASRRTRSNFASTTEARVMLTPAFQRQRPSTIRPSEALPSHLSSTRVHFISLVTYASSSTSRFWIAHDGGANSHFTAAHCSTAILSTNHPRRWPLNCPSWDIPLHTPHRV